jgi:hypothetical protein
LARHGQEQLLPWIDYSHEQAFPVRRPSEKRMEATN